MKQNLNNFIIGKSNEFAYQAIEDKLEFNTLDSCLIVYGESGTGKTHLLKAIEDVYKQDNRAVTYITAENFLNDLLQNISNQTMTKFQNEYRSCELLLIDDIHFFKEKGGVQEEFYHTIENIKNNGGEIIMTSSKHPNQIKGIVNYLESLLLSCLSIEISLPTKRMLKNIALNRSVYYDLKLDKKTIDFIVKNCDNKVNRLEGIIMKIKAFNLLRNMPINLKVVQQILKDELA